MFLVHTQPGISKRKYGDYTPLRFFATTQVNISK